MPDEWVRHVQTWSRILRARIGDVQGTAPPDRVDEYLLYQLLIGTWPAELTGCGNKPTESALATYTERLKGAMTKSVREAKVHSNWSAPDAAYEAAVLAFVDTALDVKQSSAFLAAFLPFQERIATLGVQNSLVQTTLKLTSPGVPDIYQGAELWDLSLVDPDNRRPIDYEERARIQEAVAGTATNVPALLQNWRDGGIKLFVTSRLLALRAEHPELFAVGDYEPLSVSGEDADRVCAFARRTADHLLIVVVARFPSRSSEPNEWHDTEVTLPAESAPQLSNIFTNARVASAGSTISVSAALDGLPVGVLTGGTAYDTSDTRVAASTTSGIPTARDACSSRSRSHSEGI
jgi:(1->4)-alpha-D-glucan 1-alpha-D-glucosylmutase